MTGAPAKRCLTLLALVGWLVVSACGGSDSSGPPEDVVEVGSLTVSVAQDSLILGGVLQVNAVVREVSDTILRDWPVAWTTTDTTRAVVSPAGVVTPVRPGVVSVIATSDSGTAVADTVALRLLPRAAAVAITPRPATIIISDSVQVTAVVTDSTGAVLTGRPLQWGGSGNGSVDQDGMVRALAGGSVLVVASVEGLLDSLRVATHVDGLFVAIAAGDQHVCALTVSGRAYCWGNSFVGQVGDPAYAIALSPTPVDPALRFTTISAGGSHTCATTAAGEVYCWGFNSYGQVGTSTDRQCGVSCRAVDRPTRVAGLPPAAAAWTGFEHSCAVSVAGEAWCWGINGFGQLGRGTADTLFNPVPDTVHALPQSSALGGGYAHTCAVTTAGAVQCWGWNAAGQLGIGTVDSLVPSPPRPIMGNLVFAQLTFGQTHTCGVTTSQQGWCWGSATDGKLGTGFFSQVEPAPVLISGGISWLSLSANAEHTCGVSRMNEAYCWGNSAFLATGNSGGPDPQLVNDNLPFATLAAGHYHTCGITTAGAAYCWGLGGDGKLGTGSQLSSGSPVRVTGQP